MAEVTVDATWRMSRVEFNTPYEPTGTIVGFGEVLLQETEELSPDVRFMRSRRGGKNGKTLGTMPGATVTRIIEEVKDETIEIEGVTVTFTQAMSAMEGFLKKWLTEDETVPDTMGPVPPDEQLTSVPQRGEHPPRYDDLPPPRDHEGIEPAPPTELPPPPEGGALQPQKNSKTRKAR